MRILLFLTILNFLISPTTYSQNSSGNLTGIVLRLEYNYGLGGAVTIDYQPYLFYKDGTMFSNPTKPLSSFDIETSKTSQKKYWGTWKLSGKSVDVSQFKKGKMVSDVWKENWFWAKSAPQNMRLKGSFKTLSGGGNTSLGGNTMVVNAKNIHFSEDGKFLMKQLKGGSGSEAGVNTIAYSDKDLAGTYTINGYEIEMKFNNGKIVKQLFYLYPDKDNYFGIGSEVYSPIKK